MSVAPACSNGAKYSPGWFSEPLNIRCSNRCAKPLRPAGSFLLPTPYQMLTATGSEEHTSELQSLMRISYAVFCLKKKKKTPSKDTNYIRQKHTKTITTYEE